MESSPIVEGQVTAQGRKVAVVAARFNRLYCLEPAERRDGVLARARWRR